MAHLSRKSSFRTHATQPCALIQIGLLAGSLAVQLVASAANGASHNGDTNGATNGAETKGATNGRAKDLDSLRIGIVLSGGQAAGIMKIYHRPGTSCLLHKSPSGDSQSMFLQVVTM